MPIPKGHVMMLNVIELAAKNSDLAVMEVYHVPTKTVRYIVIAVQKAEDEPGKHDFVPLAMLFEGDPYEELLPPHPNGGFINKDGSILNVK